MHLNLKPMFRVFFLIQTLLPLLILNSCGPLQAPEENFYKLHSDYDILYIPIIEPYRASSIDGGDYWSINRNELGSIAAVKFGVSENWIYGSKREGYTELPGSWFLFNVTNGLYAEYETEDQLKSAIGKFNVAYVPLRSCRDHFKTLQDSGRCYWFPRSNQSYPVYKNVQPDSSVVIEVTEGTLPDIKFSVGEVKRTETGIYFFKIKYNKKENKLVYISVDNHSPVLVRDGINIPVYVQTRVFDITIYTPFTVAQEHGISEKERLHRSKLITIH